MVNNKLNHYWNVILTFFSDKNEIKLAEENKVVRNAEPITPRVPTSHPRNDDRGSYNDGGSKYGWIGYMKALRVPLIKAMGHQSLDTVCKLECNI